MNPFLYKNRKLFLAISIFSFFYFFFEVYEGIQRINDGKKGEGIGTIADALIFLFLAIFFFINVRKATAAFKENNSKIEP